MVFILDFIDYSLIKEAVVEVVHLRDQSLVLVVEVLLAALSVGELHYDLLVASLDFLESDLHLGLEHEVTLVFLLLLLTLLSLAGLGRRGLEVDSHLPLARVLLNALFPLDFGCIIVLIKEVLDFFEDHVGRIHGEELRVLMALSVIFSKLALFGVLFSAFFTNTQKDTAVGYHSAVSTSSSVLHCVSSLLSFLL